MYKQVATKIITDADSPYTLETQYKIIIADTSAGAIIITLPTVATLGIIFKVKIVHNETGTLTINANGADTINNNQSSIVSIINGEILNLETVADNLIVIVSNTVFNKLDKLSTSDQTVASVVEFKSQVTVEGFETTSSATIAINFTTGTNTQEVDITGNISSFTTSNEKVAGNYDVWLVNDGSIRTMVAPTGWTLIPGGDTHDTAANAINLYQFKVSPSGLKRYIIKNM